MSTNPTLPACLAAPDNIHLQSLTQTVNHLQPKHAPMKGAEMDAVDVCHKCPGNTPLSQCTNQAHWEVRLRDYNLTEHRAARCQVTQDNGERVDRVVQLDYDPDRVVVGPIVLPNNPDVAEVFAMDALGVSYPKAPTRFWPFPGAVNRSAYIKTGRMGLEYGQELPSV